MFEHRPVRHLVRDPGRGPLPLTEDLDQRVLSLPLWDDMQIDELTQVVDALELINARHAARQVGLMTAA